jgi:Fe2+ or Zn2+ uptake regulation protein
MTATQRTYNTAVKRLNAYLRTQGMRVSRVRNKVLELICQLPQPFTAAQLEEACQTERISTGTVYNCLNLFIVAQILHALDRQRGRTVTEYELMPASSVRMVVICHKCNRVTEIHDKAISRLVTERKYTNFKPEQFLMYVYGECKVCRRLKATEEKE